MPTILDLYEMAEENERKNLSIQTSEMESVLLQVTDQQLMSTCRGVWRDQQVPSDVGVLMEPSSGFVVHKSTLLCNNETPHSCHSCPEFEQTRESITTMMTDEAPKCEFPHPTFITLSKWDTFFTFPGMNIFAWFKYMEQVR